LREYALAEMAPMGRPTLVFIVCSPHARVGVSTSARLLTEYYLSHNERVDGFDTDPHEPQYAALFPQIVHVVDVADIKGQISLFDRLLVNDGTPKIVDVWHRSFEGFFDTIGEIGFVEEARRRGVEPIVLFHADATEAAMAHAQALHAAWSDLTMMVVHNEAAAPLHPYAREVLARYPARGKFVIPPLDGPIVSALHDPQLSLARFLASPPAHMSIVVRAALKAWLMPIFTQFQSFELRLELESSNALR
jgi:hypothetical protein